MYCVAGAPNNVSYEDITHIHVPASKTTVMLCYVIMLQLILAPTFFGIFSLLLSHAFSL